MLADALAGGRGRFFAALRMTEEGADPATAWEEWEAWEWMGVRAAGRDPPYEDRQKEMCHSLEQA